MLLRRGDHRCAEASTKLRVRGSFLTRYKFSTFFNRSRCASTASSRGSCTRERHQSAPVESSFDEDGCTGADAES